MAADLSAFSDFMNEADDGGGFETPPMPSVQYPEGRTYKVPAPDALTGLRLSALADLGVKASNGHELKESDKKRLRLDDAEEREFLVQVLSAETLDAMVADGVRWPHVQRIGQYAFLFFGVSEEAADQAAAAGLFAGKALPGTNRAQKRAAEKKKTGTSSASAGSKKRPSAQTGRS